MWIYDEMIPDYRNMSCKMEKYYQSQDLKNYTMPLSLIAKNHLCAVRSSKSGVWERAKVLQHRHNKKNKTTDVELIDTGVVMCLSHRDVKFLKKEFSVLPPLCLHCRLAYIVPWYGAEWSTEATAYFFSLVARRRLLAKIELIKDNTVYLVLVDPLSAPVRNINKAVVNYGWGRLCFTN
ncbi:hypothetical protein KR084_000352 [Drosophila pseudotakahashii]|nr:hypothetical protein KR084_000352 [Drosophila pseudotakahashii]